MIDFILTLFRVHSDEEMEMFNGVEYPIVNQYTEDSFEAHDAQLGINNED